MKITELFSTRKKVTESGTALVGSPSKLAFSFSGDLDLTKRQDQCKLFKKIYQQIPLATAIVDVQCDQAVQEYFFEGPNAEKLQKWGDKINLLSLYYRIAKNSLIFGDAFLEAVSDDDFKMLDSIFMNIYRKDTGDIIGFSQIMDSKKLVLWGTTGDPDVDRTFLKRVSKIDSIIHFPHNILGSEKYGTSVYSPLVDSIIIKDDMEKNLKKVLFKYVAPLIWAKVGTDEFPANQTVVDDISDTLRDLQAESEITTSHLVDLQVMQFNAKGMDIATPLKHVEQQIITGGLVPPVLLGRSDGTDSKSAEVQLRSFGRHIKALQRELKNNFEDKVIVARGIGGKEDKLVWGKAEEREWEMEIDILRGIVKDGILTPQKANDLLPPRYREELPEVPINEPRDSQFKQEPKVKDNPNDPTKTTKNPSTQGKRVTKSDREVPVMKSGRKQN